MTACLDGETWSTTLVTARRRVDFGEVTGIYYRRPAPVAPDPAMKPDEAASGSRGGQARARRLVHAGRRTAGTWWQSLAPDDPGFVQQVYRDVPLATEIDGQRRGAGQRRHRHRGLLEHSAQPDGPDAEPPVDLGRHDRAADRHRRRLQRRDHGLTARRGASHHDRIRPGPGRNRPRGPGRLRRQRAAGAHR